MNRNSRLQPLRAREVMCVGVHVQFACVTFNITVECFRLFSLGYPQ